MVDNSQTRTQDRGLDASLQRAKEILIGEARHCPISQSANPARRCLCSPCPLAVLRDATDKVVAARVGGNAKAIRRAEREYRAAREAARLRMRGILATASSVDYAIEYADRRYRRTLPLWRRFIEFWRV